MFSDIPEKFQEAAASTGVDVHGCAHYQKSLHTDDKEEAWYEFEECNEGNLDVEVRAKDLKVVSEIGDNTTRDNEG